MAPIPTIPDNQYKIRNIILLCIFIVGLVWIAAIPPGYMPDEPTHYIKSCSNPRVDLVDGVYGHKYDTSSDNLFTAANFEKLRSRKGQFDFESFLKNPIYETGITGFYPHAVPNTTTVYFSTHLICKTFTAFGINKQATFYAMRIGTLLSFILIVSLAAKLNTGFFLKLSPLLAMPMIINQSVAIGADYFSIACCILSATLLVNIREKKIPTPSVFFITLFLHLNAKTVYLPLVIPVVVAALFAGMQKEKRLLLAGSLASLLALGLQLYFLSHKTNSQAIAHAFEAKLKLVFENPLFFVQHLDTTTAKYFWHYIHGAIGNIGWLDVPINSIGFYAVLGAFIVYCLYLSINRSPGGVEKVGMDICAFALILFLAMAFKFLAISIITLAFLLYLLLHFAIYRVSNYLVDATTMACLLVVISLVFLSMFLYWTPFSSRYIEGVQGRYFLPLIPFFITLFPASKSTNSLPTPALLIFVFNLIFSLSFLIGTAVPRMHQLS